MATPPRGAGSALAACLLLWAGMTGAASAATPVATTYRYRLAHCVGTKAATAWVGSRVVAMVEGEGTSSRSKGVMDRLMGTIDAMENAFRDLTGNTDLPLNGGFQGKPVKEIVKDNCGAGGLAHHGSLGMSTGAGFFNEMYTAAEKGRRALHQVFLYETARNYYRPDYNKKFDWAMDKSAASYGWWTVGFNNAIAVIIPKHLNYELLYFGQDMAQFRAGMVGKFEHYLNNKQYTFDNTWRKERLPWRQQASVNDLMTGMIIISYERFGGARFLKGVYQYMGSNEIVNRRDVHAFQECRDNVYKIWSAAAGQDLAHFFEGEMRWAISGSAKGWVAGKVGGGRSPPPPQRPAPRPAPRPEPRPAPRPSPPTGSVIRRIMGAASRLCLDVARASRADGATIEQHGCHSGSNQQWSLMGTSRGFIVMSVNSGKCLDVAGWSRSSGSRVHQWRCHGGANQLFTWSRGQLRLKHSGHCLDIAGESQSRGAQLIQSNCDRRRRSQLFQFIR